MLTFLCFKCFNYLLLLGWRKFPFNMACKTLNRLTYLSDLPSSAIPPPTIYTPVLWSHWSPVRVLAYVVSYACNVLCAHILPHFLANSHSPFIAQLNDHFLREVFLSKFYHTFSYHLVLLQCFSELHIILLFLMISN